MARKRLNKKVAIVGLAVFLVAGIGLVYLIPKLSLFFGLISPETFIKDGNTAVTAARQATDEEMKTELYKQAERSYHKARGLAKTDSLRIEMLFKLAGLHLETERWRNAAGCWNNIIRIDPKNIKALFARLKYIYAMADTYAVATGGGGGLWQEVESQASEFIKIAEDANLLAEDKAKWEYFEIEERQPTPERLGPYLYLLRGRALLEIARRGAVTDPEDSLSKAIDDLEKARELEPAHPRI
jgi:tetratricopeptide (TPR) repeat protein